MSVVSSMSRTGLLIYLFISTCIFVIQSPSWNRAHGIDLQRRSCFRSFGFPTYSFELFSNLPRLPPYIRVRSHSWLTPSDSSRDPITNTTYQHFFKVDSTCSDSYEVSNKGVLFKQWNIYLNFYIGMRSEELAEFSIRLENTSGFGVHRVFDKSKNFGIVINIRNDGDDYVHRSSSSSLMAIMLVLLLIPAENKNLCLISGIDTVVINPSYPNGETPTEHISEIMARHTVDGQVVNMVHIPAYGCGSDPSDITTDMVFLEARGREASLRFTAMHLLHEDVFSSETDLGTPETRFSLPNNEYNIITRLRKPITDVAIIPLIEVDPFVQLCYSGVLLTLMYSKSGILFDAIEQRQDIVSGGIKLIWLRHAPYLQPCRPITRN